MDPDKALRGFYRELSLANEYRDTNPTLAVTCLDDACDYALALFEWLANGGYAPDWSKR
jgi:hypothetical protein